MTSPSVTLLTADGDPGIDGSVEHKGQDGYAGSNGNHGRDATAPTNGRDGGEVNLTWHRVDNSTLLVTAEDERNQTVFDQNFQLASNVEFKLTARGGKGGDGGHGGSGGHGGEGRRGRDATQGSRGEDGEKGGDGGDGGRGSSGADGGRGGRINITVSKNETFFLMAIQNCDHKNVRDLVSGGLGGQPGTHGEAGVGGPGGPGGLSFTYEKDKIKTGRDWDGDLYVKTKTKRITVPGGNPGPPGRDGRAPVGQLVPGQSGDYGSFRITVPDVTKSTAANYPSRYDLTLKGLAFNSQGIFGPNTFEWGETVIVRDISVRNEGGMPTPSAQRVLIRVAQGIPFVLANLEDEAFIPTNSSMLPTESHDVQGQLRFMIMRPDYNQLEGDIAPQVAKTSVALQATQLGPETADSSGRHTAFQRNYPAFHLPGQTPITVRYPVENHFGLQGLKSLGCGEATSLRFAITNVGRFALGSSSPAEKKRHLAVQFYIPSSSDISADDVQFISVDKKAGSLGEDTFSSDSVLRGILKGHVVDVPSLGAGETIEMRQSLKFSPRVKPYLRAAIQCEVILQDMPLLNFDSMTDRDGLHVIQRRNLEIVSEPAFGARTGEQGEPQVILITSVATTEEQYNSWVELAYWMGLSSDCYSVSRYGHLHPEGKLPNGQTLSDAFAGKLVVVLNQEFMPPNSVNQRLRPSWLLPRGCMSQGSGFHPSTRWFFVDSNKDCERQLLTSLSNIQPDESGACTGVDDYKKWIQQTVGNERSAGKVEDASVKCNAFIIESSSSHMPKESATEKKMTNMACSMRQFLSKEDPLRKYTVEYEAFAPPVQAGSKWQIGRLSVHRGFHRTLNSAFVASDVDGSAGSLRSRRNIFSRAMQKSLADSMPTEMRISVLCRVIRMMNSLPDDKKDQARITLNSVKDALATEALFDMANFLDSKMSVQENAAENFPSVGLFLSNNDIQLLLEDCGKTDELALKSCASEELADVVARYENVAKSKDLKQWWAPFSRNRTARKAMLQLVGELRLHLEPLLDEDVISAKRKVAKQEVREHVKKDRKKSVVSVHGRWRKGMNFIYSVNNMKKFSQVGVDLKNFRASRLIELDEPEDDPNASPKARPKQVDSVKQAQSEKIKRPSVSAVTAKSFRALRQSDNNRHSQIGILVKQVEGARGDMLIKGDGNDVHGMFPVVHAAPDSKTSKGVSFQGGTISSTLAEPSRATGSFDATKAPVGHVPTRTPDATVLAQ